ncbi:amidohydrolase [Draconibacterium sp. IB214405]|uniref:amidohydrolase n=1 Tax=Draconibacterium sp. IB214405 TaxID=3097352 RepID=UPI002A0C59D8|nr:amidohydrolase [Draconibacterium sp. IB214405]MDX8339039.1 amidohydrolase [Draconibacterium sp. IB214405]
MYMKQSVLKLKSIQYLVVGLLLLVTTIATAQQPANSSLPETLVSEVESLVDKDKDRLIETFKDIHQNPELGFMEVRTAGIVAKELQKLGYEVKTGIAKTGVVGILKNGNGPVVMFRADMDAIAAEEHTGLPYASTTRVTNNEGEEVPVAHLCGHDAHTTWMLGLAKVMAELKDKWSGTLVVVGQPAEELIEGASAMVSDGLYTTHGVPEPDYLIGTHTLPVPTGLVVCSGGVLMAGTEQLDVTFYGQSSHGSSPQFSKDAGLMAAYAIVQYQAIIARVLDPRDPGVITVGAIHAGVENNTIPGLAELKLNFRFFKEEVRDQLFRGVDAINKGIARTYGMPEDKLPTIVRKGYSAPLVNDKDFVDELSTSLKGSSLVETQNVITDFPAVTGSEDCHMLVHGIEGVKVAYVPIGTAPPDVYAKAKEEGKAIPFAQHQAEYMVDLNAIPFGTKVAALMALTPLIK